MIKEFIEQYSLVKASGFSYSFFVKEIDKELLRVAYSVQVAKVTPELLARIAKQLIETDFNENEFDLIINSFGAINNGNVLFEFYLRVDGVCASPPVTPERTLFKVRGIRIDGELRIKGIPKPSAICACWESQSPFNYFLIDRTDLAGDDPDSLENRLLSIPLPETILRAICVREKIPIETLSRWPKGDSPDIARFRAPSTEGVSRLFIMTAGSGVVFENIIFDGGLVNVRTEAVGLKLKDKPITVDITFFVLSDYTPEELTELAEHYFHQGDV